MSHVLVFLEEHSVLLRWSRHFHTPSFWQAAYWSQNKAAGEPKEPSDREEQHTQHNTTSGLHSALVIFSLSSLVETEPNSVRVEMKRSASDNRHSSTDPHNSPESTDLRNDHRVPRSPAGESGDRHEDQGHLLYHVGLVIKERYEVVSTLGEGAFAKVAECIDRDTDTRVAVKIVRNIQSFQRAAKSEIAVLEEIDTLDDDNRFACVRMLDWFEHQGHVCLVFELLGRSTYEVLRQNRFLPFSVEQIRHMAFQIFQAVSFLHRNKLTHTDLKPENILFVCSDYDNERMKLDKRKTRSPDVKVVDFGSAVFDHQHHQTLVSTRHYRAPEIILELGWNQSCDVWSLACVLMEYYLGHTLFPTHDSREHLAMMEKILGPIPPHMLKQTRKRHYILNERLDWDECSSSGRACRGAARMSASCWTFWPACWSWT
ncbi:dual specificity protein kinase CLK1-like isoform X2 [Syngnathus acus]|uniref:dual specificity protein kinase CLK1-like isoform X2 n=1 Tax=Syngnathus acus TaxID=161584 RepID=UPI001885C2F2|nr:dual specificity protein kinase CLK1-like isoform X2 [Syngnathus acus]